MPTLEVRPILESDAAACAGLLAQRHRRDRERLPILDARLSEPSAWLSSTATLIANPRADGAVTLRNGTPVAFAVGERMLLSPTDFASQFIPPHSIQISLEGHAVADGEDPVSLYRSLYAFLARSWVGDGFFTHRVAIVPGDSDVQEAWVALGFGRYLTAASRETATPVSRPRARMLTIEQASPEDLDDVLHLADNLNAWHWQSPMFWPVWHLAEPAARAFNASALRSADVPYFVAYEEGRPVGMQTFLRPGFTPPVIPHGTDVYLFEGVVADEARGGGIGPALLAHSMEWAARSGFTTCTLHFASGNPSGAPFWLGHGFVPVEHTMERTVDHRVAWARPKTT